MITKILNKPGVPAADEQELAFEAAKIRAGMDHTAEVLRWVHWSRARPALRETVLLYQLTDPKVQPGHYLGEGKWRHAYLDGVVWDDSEILSWSEWPSGSNDQGGARR